MSDEIVSDRARAIVMTLGVLSLVASVGAMVYGRKLSPREISPADSYGRGPLGTRVFVESLPRLGISAWRETDIARVRSARTPVLFLAPDSDSVSISGHVHTLADIVAQRADHGLVSIVVLPKWNLSTLGVADPAPFAEVDAIADATGMTLEIERTGRADDRPTDRALGTFGLSGQTMVVPYPQTVNGGSRVLASLAEGGVVVADESDTVFVVSDADLVANFDVQRGDHAELMVSLLRSLGARSVVVDETFHGRSHTKSLAEALGEWPGVLVLVQGAFLAMASLLSGRRRFGRPVAAARAYGRGPREAIAVAADVLTLGRVPSRLASRYVELLIRDLHRRLRLREDGHSVDTIVAARAIDRLATQRGREPLAERLLAGGQALLADADRRRAISASIALAKRAHGFRAEWLAHERAEGDPK